MADPAGPQKSMTSKWQKRAWKNSVLFLALFPSSPKKKEQWPNLWPTWPKEMLDKKGKLKTNKKKVKKNTNIVESLDITNDANIIV